MSSQADAPATPPEAAPADRFTWHPQYRGRTVQSVRDELRAELASDQRAYALALEGAEQHESDTLATVVSLEKRWGPYDLDWAETDPAALADRIVAFERERDRRRELIPYAAYRDEVSPPSFRQPGGDRSTTGGALDARLVGIVVLAVVVVAVALWLLLR